MRGCLSVVVGFVTMLGLSILAGQLLGPINCRDGWASSSIGRQGACSHHGGVDRSREGLVIIFMIVGGGIGFAFYNSFLGERLDKPRQRPKPPTHRSPQPAPPPAPNQPSPPRTPIPRAPKPFIQPRAGAKACPKCGSAMKLRSPLRSHYTGRKFWGCTRYPDCTGTTNVKRR